MELDEKTLLYGIIGFLWLEYFWELYLSRRQHRIYERTVEVPLELKDILSKETFEKARLYGLDKSSFGTLKEFLSMLISTIFILLFGFLYFWNISRDILTRFGFKGDNEIIHSMVFGLLTNIYSTLISLPFGIYYTFVLEEKHGFNKQTVGFFVKDKIKAFVVGQMIMLPVIAAVVKIVRAGGDYFFFYLWLFAMIVTFFLLTIYPDYIAPLFDKYTPLPEGDLRTKIEELASSLQFPLYEMYVVEGSKRSVHSNAYFYGFYKKKRIVLFDTLLKDYTQINKKDAEEKEEEKEKQEAIEGKEKQEAIEEKVELKDEEKEGKGDKKESKDSAEKKTNEQKGCSDEEVIAVLGHELGHWKLNHVIKNLCIMQINLFLMFLVFGLLFQYKTMYRAFGFVDEQPVLIGFFIVLQFLFSPYNTVLGYFLTSLSRRFEFQADSFAQSLGHGKALCDALIKLNTDNLGFPVYDPLFSKWHHSHPPLLQRLNAIQKTE